MIRLKTKIDNFLSYSEPVDCHSETEVPSTTFRNSEIPPRQSSDGRKRVTTLNQWTAIARPKSHLRRFVIQRYLLGSHRTDKRDYSEPVDCHSETEVPSTTFRNSEIPPRQSSDGQKRLL
ncbi:unnamed protein product [Caenorhabditis nigoni]